MILADTNILLRSLSPWHSHYPIVEKALFGLRQRREKLYIAPQNVVEFWAVATRPRGENGLGLTLAKAAAEIDNLSDFFELLVYTSDVLKIWRRIVTAQNVSGKRTHDAHLVAMMQVHSISDILTFNGADFSRFPGINVLDPAQV